MSLCQIQQISGSLYQFKAPLVKTNPCKTFQWPLEQGQPLQGLDIQKIKFEVGEEMYPPNYHSSCNDQTSIRLAWCIMKITQKSFANTLQTGKSSVEVGQDLRKYDHLWGHKATLRTRYDLKRKGQWGTGREHGEGVSEDRGCSGARGRMARKLWSFLMHMPGAVSQAGTGW